MQGMRKACRPYLLGILLATALLSCGDGAPQGHATPQAAKELAAIMQALPEMGVEELLETGTPEEIEHLLQAFTRTPNASLKSTPSGITMLHLACLFKQNELARCLLLDGADPNATTAAGDTPLGLAVSLRGAEPENTTGKQQIALVETLRQNGAKLHTTTGRNELLINHAGLNSHSEELFLHLLDAGCPTDATTCIIPAAMGWNTALRRMLPTPQGNNTATRNTMLVQAAANLHEETVQQLLAAGADPNARTAHGTTALLETCLHLLSPAEDNAEQHHSRVMSMCILLLRHGADPHLSETRIENSPAFCAADILTKDPASRQILRQNGLELTPPPIHYTEGIPLIIAVCKTGMLHRHPAPENFAAIATILSPTEEMLHHPLYAEALPLAVEQLHEIDAAKTSAAVAAMPLWTSSRLWQERHGNALLDALQHSPGIVLPPELLESIALKLHQTGQWDEAATLIELLARHPQAPKNLQRLCRHTAPPIQAGALAAELLRQGLPTPRDGDVETWLRQHNRTANTPPLRKALLLTSLSRLWYGDMPPHELHAMLAAMEEAGAPEIAARYRAIAAALDNPEELDQLTADSKHWKFTLEIATAHFILKHRDAFLPPKP